MQILPSLNQGGVERGTLEMAEAILAAGGRSLVVSSGGVMVTRLKRMGAEHIALPVASKNPLRWPFIRRRLRQIMVEEGVNLVHVRSRAPAWIAMAAARRIKVPVVSTIHGRFKAGNIFKRYYNSIMVRSDHIIAISRYIAGLVKDQFPKIAKHITTIHRGVDINMFDPAKVSAQRVINAAHHLGIPDHKKVVMLPARPSLWKGQQITIEAMAKLDQKDIILVLVGALSGKAGFQQSLTSSISQLGLEGRVKLAPESQDMPAALMLADVVVMPSLTPEPFGRVAIEAQAMGRPVVAFNHGGAAESIIPGETGWLAEPGNVDSLGTAIAEALALKVLERKQFANRARQHIVANFSTDLMVSKTLSVYGKALKSALV